MKPNYKSCQIIMPSIFDDVMERRQEEDVLYLSIIQIAKKGIQAMDDQLRATYVDPQLAKMFGFDPDQMLDESFSDFMSQENLSEIIVE